MANKPGEANFFPDVPQFPSMGTFQPVYGKFDLTTYIQGASDYEIMAFLVGKYNACLEAYGNITKLSTDTITACKQLQDWINSWFDNLDVQQELNNKIDSMVADGSFATLLHQTFDAQVNQQAANTTTAWLVANVTPTGSAVVVDKSLTIEGAAADAKKVGDTCFRFRGALPNESFSLANFTEIGTYGGHITVSPTDAPKGLIVPCDLIVVNMTGFLNGQYTLQSIFNAYNFYAKRIVSNITGKPVTEWYLGDYVDNGYIDKTNWSLSDYTHNGSYGFSYEHNPIDIPTDATDGDFAVFNISGFRDEKYTVQILYGANGYNNWRIVNNRTNAVYRDWQTSNTGSKVKLGICGDSFCDAYAEFYPMAYFMNKYDKYNAISLSTSGITAQDWYYTWGDKITPDYDVLIIALGLNDNEEVGNYTDEASLTTTYCAAIKYIIIKMLEKAPTARVILWGMDAWFSIEKSNALYSIAKLFGIECWCMRSDINVPIRINGKYGNVAPYLDANYALAKTKAYRRSDSDNHPNNAGRKMLAEYWSTII